MSRACPNHKHHTTPSTIFVGSTIYDFLLAWFVMLGLGVLHGEWSRSVPALGYWPTWLITFAGTALVGGCFYGLFARLARLIELAEDAR